MDPGSNSVFLVPLEGDSKRNPHDGALAVYRTTDGGGLWQRLDRGLPATHEYGNVLRGAMSIDGLDPCGVYFGTTGGSIHYSRDQGENWKTLPCSLPRILSVDAFVLADQSVNS
jgi:hypothetical protein